MADDFHYLSLDEVARRLKARKLSSVEATQAMLDRIARLDPKLKSYATVTPERALADAKRLDAETAAGKSRGDSKRASFRRSRRLRRCSIASPGSIPSSRATPLSRPSARWPMPSASMPKPSPASRAARCMACRSR